MSNEIPQLNSFALDTREDLVINAIEIFDTIKQSLMVLDKNLNVVMANSAFYKTFEVTKKETEKVMLLNAREILRQDNRKKVILLAIEDITASKQLEKQAKEAETHINAILD